MIETTCAPDINIENQKVPTCYSKNDLILIAKKYNEKHKNDKINLKLSKLNLWKELKEKHKDVCVNNEFCWLKKNFVSINSAKFKDIKDKFRPLKPNSWNYNPTEWLDTFNILFVMKQYEKKDNTFKFMGVFPIDFMDKYGSECVSNEMCNMNIVELYNSGIKKIGIVLNLDKSWQEGSHWTAVSINIEPKQKNFGFYYYDSASNKPPKEVKELYNVLKKQLNNKKNIEINNNKLVEERENFKLDYNKIKHQKKNSECGMFSIYFLDQFIKNKHIQKTLSNKNLNDDYVFNLRKKFFTSTN